MLPDVPVRQWVLTAPYEVRRVVALRPDHEIVLIDPETEAVESIGGADLPSYAVSSPDGP